MMQVHAFDDRMVCNQEDQPTFMVELWSWDIGENGAQRNTTCSSYTLQHCDVEQALTWCREHQQEPGSFVLHACTWTNCGYLQTLWLTGSPPTPDRDRSAATRF
jgi:hypothetical protein